MSMTGFSHIVHLDELDGFEKSSEKLFYAYDFQFSGNIPLLDGLINHTE